MNKFFPHLIIAFNITALGREIKIIIKKKAHKKEVNKIPSTYK